MLGSGLQTHLKPSAQARDTVEKDILDDIETEFVSVCWSFYIQTHSCVAVVEETEKSNNQSPLNTFVLSAALDNTAF